jgi:hypothetical protein
MGGMKRFKLLFVPMLFAIFHQNGTAMAKEDKPVKLREPTVAPSITPSFSPSSRPTQSLFPTDGPTELLTDAPTRTATLAPTHSTVSLPTQSQTVAPILSEEKKSDLRTEALGALLPVIMVDLIISDEDAALPLAKKIDSFVDMFLDNILASNSGPYNFDYSHLDSNVIVSVFNGRRLNTGMSLKIDGIAYYFGEPPSRESLVQTMKVYFSFWGKR